MFLPSSARDCPLHLAAFVVPLLALLALSAPAAAQSPAPPLTLVSPGARQPLESIEADGRRLVPLRALASLFRLDLRDDTATGTLALRSGEQEVLLTAGERLVSVGGRLVSLASPPRQIDGRWWVPLDFINRALSAIADRRVEVRPRSDLVLIGEVDVPRVAARYRPRARTGRLSVETTPGTAHRIIEEPGRLRIRFEADAIDVVRLSPARGEIVRSIEVDADLPGLTVELGPAFDSFRVTQPTAAGGEARLVIDLLSADAAASAGTAGGAARPGAERASAGTRPARPAGPAARARPGASPAPRPGDAPRPGGDRPDAEALPDFAAAPTIRTIVVDAGHGGTDEGAHGPDGTLEKNVTLGVARRLRAALEARLGARVILTRTGDTVVPIDERASIANNNKADLFISLHANSSRSVARRGAEVFYLSIDEYGAEAREVAEREAPLLSVVGGGAREIDIVEWEMAQARHVDRSERLAELVEDELRQRVPMSPRAIQQAPFRVLVGANMPAVLVEMGFISNPDQERQLTAASFQNEVVDAVIAAVLRFRDYLERLPSMPADDEAVGDAATGIGGTPASQASGQS
ncbi:MAG: N-acetylmuramoyl-L-alanine amidase [Acidobacteria bacterium]|nr:N-acetylmuramoyl-L-alanine amidase [Acidobacteriota bacterium]